MTHQPSPSIPLGMSNPIDMNMHMALPVPGLDVVQKLFLSFGLDPTHLMSLGMALTVLASLGGFLTYAMNGFHSLWTFISNNCISSATIHSSDQAYLYVMKWLATNRISTDCRKFCVTSRKNPNSARVKRFSMYNFHNGRGGQDEEDDDDEEDDLGPKLKYNPAPGLSYFWYRWHLIIIHRVLDNPYLNNDAPDETLVLMTIGRSPNLLRALLAEARTHYLQSESRKTTVYTINTSNFQKCWDNGRSRASRDISTVIMEDKDKDLILRDTKDYLNPVTARWYAARGLPYRRGYLFYGPPGTGKTSLTLALAGELKLNLYIFNLGAGGGVTDETLGQLFQALPKKCIVLLEDIDCAGIGRGSNSNLQGFMYPYENSFEGPTEEPEEEVNTQSVERQSDQQHGVGASEKFESAGRRAIGPESRSSGDTTASKDKDKLTLNTTHSRMSINSMQYPTNHKPASQISFSGLLNAIDGVASHEGRILIMTTNYRERLDPALIRPGRVDVEIEFGFASKETIRRVFTELYKGLNNLPEQPLPQHMSPRKDPYDGEDAIYHPSPDGSIISGYEFSCGDGFKDAGDIELLAQKFANAVPSGVFTPAELQGFLMMHKQNPGMAVKEVGGWVNKKYATRGSQGTTRVNRTSTTVPEAPISETRRNSWELLPRDTVSTNLSSDKIPASTGQTLQDVSRGDKNVPSAPATLKSEARQSSCNTGQSEQ